MHSVQTQHPAYNYDQLSMETDTWSDDFQYTDYIYYAALYCSTIIQWKWAVEVITESFCTTIYRQAITALVYMRCEPVDDSIRSVLATTVERQITADTDVLKMALQYNSPMQFGLTSLLGADQEEDNLSLPTTPVPPPSPTGGSAPAVPSPERVESSGSALASPIHLALPPRPGHRRGLSQSQELVMAALTAVEVPAEQIHLHLMTAIYDEHEQMALEMVGQLDPAVLQRAIQIAEHPKRTALISAIDQGLAKVALAITRRLDGDQLNVSGDKGFTPLMWAISKIGQLEIGVARAIYDKQDPEQTSIQDTEHLTALMVLMWFEGVGMEELGLEMIETLSLEQVNMRDRSGYTALMFAIINRKENLALALAEKLNPRELQITRAEQSVMHFVYNHKLPQVGVAIAAKLRVENTEGFVELMCAIFHNNEARALEAVAQLSKEELQKKDIDGLAPMTFAIRQDMTGVCQAIVKKITPQDDSV